MIPIVVKHVGTKYEMQVEGSWLGSEVKRRISELTGKLLGKGGQLKDDASIESLKIKPGHVFMMLGTAKDLPKPPANAEKPTAQIDEPKAPKESEPGGLTNFDNVCYSNAIVQLLRCIPEVVGFLRAYRGRETIVRALHLLFAQLEASAASDSHAVHPNMFLVALRSKFPQFDEREPQGLHKQQDAEELWTQLMQTLSQEPGFAKDLFLGRFETLRSSHEADESDSGVEEFTKLPCHISVQTNYLKDGLLAGLKETMERHSESLGRNAEFSVAKKISRLPKYLVIHMVRFFWRRDTQKKSKILRKVAFPFQLDVYDMCTPELQQKLGPSRLALREYEGAAEEARRLARRQRFSSVHKVDEVSEELPSERRNELVAACESRVTEAGLDTLTNPYGVYELAGVVTHAGMSADSGHYQAFIKHDTEPDRWWRFNDDRVMVVDDERINQLAGGGESDSALMLLYRAPRL